MSFTQESAEILALQVLAWLASDDDLLPVFQGSTGVSDADLKAGATDVHFLASVLDFITMDDTWVIQCCDAIGVNYDQLLVARQSLPGGDQVHWT